jgi:alpha-glucosidase
MIMKKGAIPVVLLLLLLLSAGCSRKLKLTSPDGRLKMEIRPGGGGADSSVASFTLKYDRKIILLPSPLFIITEKSQKVDGINLIRIETESINRTWINNLGEKKEVPESFNQLKLFLMSNGMMINVICRAYNEGIALAYEFPEQEGRDSISISSENIHFRFTADHMAWSAPRAQAIYSHVPLTSISEGCERPLVIEADSNIVLALGEAALVDYPRMKYDPDSSSAYSLKSHLDGPAKRAVPFRSPWRYIMTGNSPGDLLVKNYFLLNLNDSSGISDESWIRPGKVLREVTLTTEGGKAAVDFTSSHGMQYIEFDAGWYGPENNDASDARAVNLDPARSKGPLDLKEVISYAGSKNIGVLLYVNRRALERQIDSLLPIYKEWGVKGIKFGFVQVGNQEVTLWLHESVRQAAAYNMVVDIHDEYRPTGYSRTYPNLLTQEGIRGDEESPTNSHTLITMFTRMIAGAGDNTICYYNDRVEKKMGSHASQLAKAVCIFSPLQFLYWYDRALNIGDEPELEFFNNVPTVWDETRVLHGRIGEYGVIARRSGDDWFIGGINGDSGRTLDIKFDFLESGRNYTAKIYTDDPAVQTRTHVKVDSIEVSNTSVYKASLKPNNGIAIHIFELQ